MGPRTDVDDVERRKILPLLGLELRPLCRPACSQSLYRLRYPGSFIGSDISLITQFEIMTYLNGNKFYVVTTYQSLKLKVIRKQKKKCN
jgi:hypothetical protein